MNGCSFCQAGLEAADGRTALSPAKIFCLPVFAPFDEREFFHLGLQEIRTPNLKVVAVLVGPCLSNRTV